MSLRDIITGRGREGGPGETCYSAHDAPYQLIKRELNSWRAWGAGIHTGHTGTRITQTILVGRCQTSFPIDPRAERTSSCDGGGLLASVADIERFSTGSAGAGAPAGSGDDASCASGWSAWM